MSSPGRKSARYSQAARVLVLLDLLRGHRTGLSNAQLSEQLEVTPRQIRRDLLALAEAGYETETARCDDGVFRTRLTRARSG